MEPVHLLPFEQAARRPGACAVIDADGREVSYGAHRAAILETSERLAAAGLGPGDRLVIAAENCHAATALIFAASVLGAVAVPVNARMTPAEIDRIVEHAAPRVIAFTSAASGEAAAHAARMGASGEGVALASGPGGGEAAAEGTAVILYTTGTTGAPKGVMLTHGNLRFAGVASATLRGMQAGDRVYGVLPLTHVFGLASMLMAATHAGATIQLETRFTPERLHAALTGGVTIFPGVPQMHAVLMSWIERQGMGRLASPSLRYVSSGAAPLDPAWKRKAEAFYGLALQNGYGMTESTAGVSATRNPMGSGDTSVGPPLPGVDIVVDEDAGGADPGVGEVLTRGPHVMAGYYRAPGPTGEAIRDGWLRTGDLGRIDGEGRLHIVGRRKELIIRGGFNVYPPEVEAALNDHPKVIQSAVIGRTVHGDEQVLAFVQCADPGLLDLGELRAFCGERLAPYKRPTHILAGTSLPAAPTGKILKHRLLEAFGDALRRLDDAAGSC